MGRDRYRKFKMTREADEVGGMGSTVLKTSALAWGLIAPLNLVKVLMNKVSPMAKKWVPSESEQCQQDCGIARMWACLYWASQIALCLGLYRASYRNMQQASTIAAVCIVQKIFVA